MARKTIPLLFFFLRILVLIHRVTKFQIALTDYSFSDQSEVPLYIKSSTAKAFAAVLCQVIGNPLVIISKSMMKMSWPWQRGWT